MKRLVLVAAVALGLGASAASATAPTAFYGCRAFTAAHPAAVVKPRSIVVACGDGNFYVTGARWSSWTAASAAGTAIAHANDCTPNCAAGHFHTYAVAVTLSHPVACKGRSVFMRIAWRYMAAHPAGAARSGSSDFGC